MLYGETLDFGNIESPILFYILSILLL